ncbi:MAG TPA: TonB-dependent receptor [Steroidobacteraceae bacterium]|nr:TonB-dependent receptor [Steroidobacteraceae bacterium]
MALLRSLAMLLALGFLSFPVIASQTEEGTASPVTVYPASYFAATQPSSAFDMLTVLPGYDFNESDADVRGFAGAVGNVLIDGSRPAGKQESLEAILRRIPASAVERVELIRAGATGIDMQGQAVLANVIRRREAQTRGALEASSTFYERGLHAPRAAAEMSRRNAGALLELSAAAYETVDDEHGFGRRPRVAPDGTLLRSSVYSQDEGEKVREAAGSYQRAVLGGLLRLSASLQTEKFGADIAEHVTFPEVDSSTVREFEDERNSELGAHFQRPLASGRQLELFAIHRASRERGGERAIEADGVTLFRQGTDGSESIFRSVLRWDSGQLSLESGVEGALNVLDSHNSLEEDGAPAVLPNGAVRVEERRGEVFATASWPLSSAWRVEAGSRFEYSRLELSGDSTLGKSFFFPKPRLLLTWSASERDRLRVLLEREVGQLDFEDFAGSASLSASTVTAGNPDLEPDRTWRLEAAWERHFLESGVLLLAARHERIQDLIDRIPVIAAEPFDAVGNIGDGRRSELEVNLTLPLDRFGIRAGLLKTVALWRDSSARDPTTGESRPISEDLSREVAIHFSQQLAPLRVRWGVDATLASAAREHYFDEVRNERLGTRLDVFAQYEPSPAWNIRVFANNLTDRNAVRERRIYDGLRSAAPLRYIETRTLAIGPYVGIAVRRMFGD